MERFETLKRDLELIGREESGGVVQDLDSEERDDRHDVVLFVRVREGLIGKQ